MLTRPHLLSTLHELPSGLLQERPRAFAPEYLSSFGPWGPYSPLALAHHRPFQVLWGPSLSLYPIVSIAVLTCLP